MNASTLGLLGLLAVQSAALPKFIVPAIPDVTIKTRRTTDYNSGISTTVVYYKGARQRTETITIVSWPPNMSAGTGSGTIRRLLRSRVHHWCPQRRPHPAV